MILRNLGSSAVAGALVLLAVSCGSSEKDPAGAGGSGATGGTATSAGGSTSTSGATSVAGAANMGGSTASGGASASGGGGGMPGPGNFGCPAQKPEASSACMRGGNLPACTYDDGGCVCQDGAWTCYADADCPAAAPADDAACTLTGMACGYGDVNCTCSMGGEWTCASPCPMAEPGADASCRRAENSTCRYNMGTLVGGFGMADTTCSCASGKFSCFSQEDCPAAAPAQMSACTTATLGCMYDDRQCTCTGGAWNCQTSCPAAPPSDGAECLRPENATCRYNMDMLVQGGFGQADTTCACSDDKFSCFGQEDCPASAPVDGATCEFSTLSCDWEATGCTCNNGMWACTTDCPAAPPAQDAACDRSEQAVCRYNDGMLASGMGGSADALCTCRENKFDCLTQMDCPQAAPMSESACTGLNNLSCSYMGTTCTCSGAGGMGGMMANVSWNCQTECPAAPPAAGVACTRPVTSACRYQDGALVTGMGDAEDTCVCSGNMFTCYSAADCPAARPENNAACEQPGLECPFDGQTCRCRTSTNAWNCGGGMMMGGMGGSPGTGGATGTGGTTGAGGTTGTGGAMNAEGGAN